MSTRSRSDQNQAHSPWRILASLLVTFLVIGSIFVAAIVALTPLGQSLGTFFRWLFAADSTQIWWYVTRASGIIAYLLLWLSSVLGLAVTSKYLDGLLDRLFTYDFHEFISLLGLAFMLVHALVLMLDHYLPYTLTQVLVPFTSPYRPFWVGFGVISFYIIVLVTVTFYLRSRIGTRSFRVIHYLSLLGYLGATLHGYFSGTDTALLTMQIIYKVSGLVVLLWTLYWLFLLGMRKRETRHTVEPSPVPHGIASR
jgi:predicted ferric reductase